MTLDLIELYTRKRDHLGCVVCEIWYAMALARLRLESCIADQRLLHQT